MKMSINYKKNNKKSQKESFHMYIYVLTMRSCSEKMVLFNSFIFMCIYCVCYIKSDPNIKQ